MKTDTRTKRLTRQLTVYILIVAMLFSMTAMFPLAAEAETEDPGTNTETDVPGTEETTPPEEDEPTITYPSALDKVAVDIKAGASEASVKEGILAKVTSAVADYDVISITWPDTADVTTAGTITAQANFTETNSATVDIEISVIEATGYDFKSSPAAIYSDAAENKSKSTLLNYVNADLAVVRTGDDAYDAAIGTVPAEKDAARFTWNDTSMAYTEAGGVTYTFVKEYTANNGDVVVLSRNVTVTHKVNTIGNVSIYYSDNTVSTTKNMKWTLDPSGGSWSSCQDNMSIKTNWHGNTVYFYVPGNKYASDSEIVALRVPEQAEKPTAKLKLTSTVQSITINNCWDFDFVEFSINGTNWITTKSDTYTFTGLEGNTSYTVYVRTRAVAGSSLASVSVRATIKTAAPIETSVDVQYAVNEEDRSAAVDATAIIAPVISTKTLTGSLTANDLTKFCNVFDTYDSRYGAVNTSLTVIHYAEEDETKEITGTKFTIPMSAIRDEIEDGALNIEYRSEFGRVIISNRALDHYTPNTSYGTLTISMKEVSSVSAATGWKWLKDEMKNGNAVVYTLEVGSASKKDATVTYTIPYPLGAYDNVDSVNVYHVDSKGEKTSISASYDALLGGYTFTTDKSGYFALVNDGIFFDLFPFKDVKETHWAYDYIGYCYNQGLFVGTSTTTFSPNLEVNRATIVTLLGRLDGVDADQTVADTRFDDVAPDAWYAPYAAWSYDTKLIRDKEFNGTAPMQRQEIAKLIYDYLKLEEYDVSYDKELVEQYTDNKDITSKYRDAVMYLRSVGIMNGMTEDTFGPTGHVTRAQMATIMYRLYEFVD